MKKAGAAVLLGLVCMMGMSACSDPKQAAIDSMCQVIVHNTTGGAMEKGAKYAADAAVEAYKDSPDSDVAKIAKAAQASLDGAQPHTARIRNEGMALCRDLANQ